MPADRAIRPVTPTQERAAGRPPRRFTVPDEPALAPEKVGALRDARLLLLDAARDGTDAGVLPALQHYVRAACAAGFARLTVRHTVAAALLPATAGRDEARRRRVQQWLGYTDQLYDRLAPR